MVQQAPTPNEFSDLVSLKKYPPCSDKKLVPPGPKTEDFSVLLNVFGIIRTAI